MKTPDLKPCPFCGGEATMEDNAGEYPIFDEIGNPFDMECREATSFWVECDKCRTISGVSESETEAAAIWNRRMTDA